MQITKKDLTSTNILNQVLSGTIANVAASFLIDARARGLSPNTLRSYTNETSVFITWCDSQGVIQIDELTADVFRKYLLSLQARRNPGGQFAGYRVIRTLTFWWEKETDDSYRSPVRKVKPPKVNNQALPGISQDQIDSLLSVCDGPTRQRDRALLLFLADTGVRASELTHLKLIDLDLMTGFALIVHGKGNKKRSVFFGQKTRRELRKYLTSRGKAAATDPLFAKCNGQPLTFSGLRQIVRRRAKQAGISEPGLHDFRRYFALTMLRNGVDLATLARLMGHTGITVLQRYLALVDDDLQAGHQRSGPVDHAHLG